MVQGYIKISRKLFHSDLWTERRRFSRVEAWIDILQKAAFKKIKIGQVVCQRGQLIVSNSDLSVAWGWGRGQVFRFLDELSEVGRITKQKLKFGTLITVCKYESYQSKVQVSLRPGTQNGTQNGTVNSLIPIDDSEKAGTHFGTQNGTLFLLEEGRNKKEGIRRHSDKSARVDLNQSDLGKEGEGFEEFWQMYPKRSGKAGALEAWTRVVRNGDRELIKAALEWQKKSKQWKEEGGRFIPKPKTYIMEKLWLDEPGIHGVEITKGLWDD